MKQYRNLARTFVTKNPDGEDLVTYIGHISQGLPECTIEAAYIDDGIEMFWDFVQSSCPEDLLNYKPYEDREKSLDYFVEHYPDWVIDYITSSGY